MKTTIITEGTHHKSEVIIEDNSLISVTVTSPHGVTAIDHEALSIAHINNTMMRVIRDLDGRTPFLPGDLVEVAEKPYWVTASGLRRFTTLVDVGARGVVARAASPLYPRGTHASVMFTDPLFMMFLNNGCLKHSAVEAGCTARVLGDPHFTTLSGQRMASSLVSLYEGDIVKVLRGPDPQGDVYVRHDDSTTFISASQLIPVEG